MYVNPVKELASSPYDLHYQKCYIHNNTGLLYARKTIYAAQILEPLHSLLQGGVTNKWKVYPNKLLILSYESWLKIFLYFTDLGFTDQRLKRTHITMYEKILMLSRQICLGNKVQHMNTTKKLCLPAPWKV